MDNYRVMIVNGMNVLIDSFILMFLDPWESWHPLLKCWNVVILNYK